MTESIRNAAIVSIGEELLAGDVTDTNAAWLAAELAGLGIRTREFRTIGDDADRICQTLRELAGRYNLLLTTGGLGPTDDDVTREALAAACGCVLEYDPRSLEQIRAFYARLDRPMPESNRRQALRPTCGEAIENRSGTAPGLRVRIGRCVCFALPGVPFEMRTMFDRSLRPWLAARAAGRTRLTRLLHCCGAGEATIGQKLTDLMRARGPVCFGTTAEPGIITVRMTVESDDPGAARHQLDLAERLVRQRLGSLVFGADGQTLAGAVGQRLADRGQTLAVAESCTGGLLGALITDVPGASRYFRGGVISYANEVKQALLGVPAAMLEAHGAVSAEVAAAMVRAVCARLGSDWGLSVTGIAGPTGGTPDKPVGLVCLGLAGPGVMRVRTLRFSPDQPRSVIRLRSCYAALDALRRALDDTPVR